MRHASTIKHTLLTLGFGALLAACGGDETTTPDTVNWNTIQTDLKNNGCTASAVCHAAGSTNRLKIDVTSGKEMTNYMSVINASPALINKQAAAQSDLITVPKTGMTKTGATHQTLGATTLDKWTKWITDGAAF